MTTIYTLFQFSLCLLTIFLCGFGINYFLLPKKYEEYRSILAFPIGYCILVWLGFNISGILNVAVTTSIMVSFLILSGLSLYALVKSYLNNNLKIVLSGIGKALLLSLPISIFTLFPLFIIGADTYLGSVNPDWFFALRDNYFLVNESENALSTTGETISSYTPFTFNAGNISLSARFIGAFLGILFESLFGFSSVTSLILCVSIFIYCLPLSMFFTIKEAFGQNKVVAYLAAVLIGVSGPISMSYLYFYIGQNSALAITPLLLTLLYLVFTQFSWRLMILTIILISSLFSMYFAMLPYAIAPIGLFAIYLMFSNRNNVWPVLKTGIIFLVTFSIINIPLIAFYGKSLVGWFQLIGQTLQGQYFLTFLTEEFFPIFYGIISYPIYDFLFYQELKEIIRPLSHLLSLFITIWLVFTLIKWYKDTKEKRASFMLYFISLIIYVIVWYRYTILNPYGYAVFKMAAWLQFMLVTLYAIGFYNLWQIIKAKRNFFSKSFYSGLFAVLVFLIIGGNINTAIENGTAGFGQNTHKAKVNLFDFSGNHDHLELPKALKKLVKKDESIGLRFINSIQQQWMTYYLKDFRVSLLGRSQLPGDDENLPDPITHTAIDFYGNIRLDNNGFFHGIDDEYYLTWNEKHLNKDIAEVNFPNPPIWENNSYQLFKDTDVPDFFFCGRGFYRQEYDKNKEKPYWWPERFRWSSEGGQVYLLEASNPMEPYHLSFTALAGIGKRTRTMYLWHNDSIFDTIHVNGAARIISKPFYPTGGVDTLTIAISPKDYIKNISRPYAWYSWNRDIPMDYRIRNSLFGSIKIFSPRNPLNKNSANPSKILSQKTFFDKAITFNGIELDGWLTDSMSMRYYRPKNTTKITFSFFIPGHSSYTLPYSIDINILGKNFTFQAEKYGQFDFTFELPPKQNELLDYIKINPEKSFETPSSESIYKKSVQLLNITYN